MSFLKIEFLNNNTQQSDEYKFRNTPFIENEGEIFFSPIQSAEKLTNSDSVKRVYKIVLNSPKLDFLPGDTIGVLPCNNKEQVEKIFTRLKLWKVDQVCKLGINPNTTKKNPIILKHLPPISTLRNIFLKHVDIEAPPKKLFLKTLSNFAENEDKIRIENLTKSSDYFEFISTCGGLLGLLDAFPTLQPPVETLLENLPPLQPRPYSISSSPLVDLEITFFVVDRGNGKKGICTGWLEDLIEKKNGLVPFYFRKSTNFRFCDTDSILIATGTGISPFRSFLQHINLKKRKGKVWLIYGCRNDEDFLFKSEIQEFDFLTLDVAFSRKNDSDRCHVQDILKKKSEEFMRFITEEDAKVFICGDFKTVVKDVKLCICEIFKDADVISVLEKKGKLAVDTWA